MAGVAPKDLSDILPTSLIYGYGEKTCSLLLMLCEILLLKIKHSWLPFKYESQSGEIEGKNKNKNFAKSSGWIEDVSTVRSNLVKHICMYLSILLYITL